MVVFQKPSDNHIFDESNVVVLEELSAQPGGHRPSVAQDDQVPLERMTRVHDLEKLSALVLAELHPVAAQIHRPFGCLIRQDLDQVFIAEVASFVARILEGDRCAVPFILHRKRGLVRRAGHRRGAAARGLSLRQQDDPCTGFRRRDGCAHTRATCANHDDIGCRYVMLHAGHSRRCVTASALPTDGLQGDTRRLERGLESLGEPLRPLGVAVHANRLGGEGDSRAVSRLDRAVEHHLEHA